MVRNSEKLEDLQRRWIAEHPTTYEDNRRMMNAMASWAQKLGQFPRRNMWEGIDEIIAFSRILRRVRPSP